MEFDHVAIVAERLEDGAAFVEDVLGIAPGPGGTHAAMGTHNRLLSLGPDAYLEVIAIDPDAPQPDRPRWFDLDRVTGPPRVGAWVARTDDLPGALGEAPMGMGDILPFERGDLSWSMAVPRGGQLPWHGCAPALIKWKGTARPAPRLPQTGLRLQRLVIRHPHAETLRAEWPAVARMDRVAIVPGAVAGLEVEIVTPRGLRTLSGLTESA